MSQLLTHRGFQGTVLYSAEDRLLHGRVIGIPGLVSYEGASVADLEGDFRNAVEEYLQFAGAGQSEAASASEPVPFPLPRELHERAIRFAEEHNTNLNEVLTEAVSRYLAQAA